MAGFVLNAEYKGRAALRKLLSYRKAGGYNHLSFDRFGDRPIQYGRHGDIGKDDGRYGGVKAEIKLRKTEKIAKRNSRTDSIKTVS